MSDNQGSSRPQHYDEVPTWASALRAFLSGLLVLFGILMLLPGLCIVLVYGPGAGSDSSVHRVLLACFASFVVGLVMIYAGVRWRGR